MRADQVEAAWRLLMPVFEVWAVAPSSDFPNYAAGTWGPEAPRGLIAQQGHSTTVSQNLMKPLFLADFSGFRPCHGAPCKAAIHAALVVL